MENQNTKINFQELFVNMLSKLSEREQEVLKRRYQLLSEVEKKSTLRQIGDIYNITRERVRQIECEAVRKIIEIAKSGNFADGIKSIEQELIEFLEKRGGLSRHDYLLEQYVKTNHHLDFLHNNAFIFTLDFIIDAVEKIDNHDSFHCVWVLKDVDIEQAAELISAIEKEIKQAGRLHSQEEILRLAEDNLPAELKSKLTNYIEKHGDLELRQLLESYLHGAVRIDKNILEQWGLADWETVYPKKLSNKILLIFDKHNSPLHFREIAEKINQANFDRKNICAATAHNELIANDAFVLVGRGIYAKKDWGYSEGTVADIITSVLKQAGGALDKETIYDKVLQQRRVNQSTIYLTLINKEKFERTADGKFKLK